jgi:CDP-glucose 4,6-dehydratase
MKNISKFYKNKKILITGITGFKGAWLASFLLILGANVHGIASKKKKNNLFHKLKLEKKIDLKILDIRDFKKLNNYIKTIKPSIVFHFAGQTIIYNSYKFPHRTFDVNSMGGLNILEVTRQSKFIKSLIITTSDKCYESKRGSKGFKEDDRLGGIDPYSASKVSVEIMLKSYQESFFKKKLIGASSVRSGNVIGGGDFAPNRLIPDCIKSIKKNKTIFLRNPNFNRPWQFVLEPLKGYLILAQKQYMDPKNYSNSWNFGTKPNTVTNVKKIVKYLVDFWGKGKIKILKNNFYEQMNLQLDISKAQKFLKWSPTYNIKDSVKLSVDWYKKVLLNKENPIKVTEEQIKKYMYDSKIN